MNNTPPEVLYYQLESYYSDTMLILCGVAIISGLVLGIVGKWVFPELNRITQSLSTIILSFFATLLTIFAYRPGSDDSGASSGDIFFRIIGPTFCIIALTAIITRTGPHVLLVLRVAAEVRAERRAYRHAQKVQARLQRAAAPHITDEAPVSPALPTTEEV